MPAERGRDGKFQQSGLNSLSEEFRRLQNQKSPQWGGVESRVLRNLCMYYAEHFVKEGQNLLAIDKLDPNKLWLVFNFLRKSTRKKIGRMMSAEPAARARPDKVDPRAYSNAEVVTQLTRALDEKVVQPMRLWEIYFWMTLGGVAVEYCPWIENVTEEPLPQYDEVTGELLWRDNLNGDRLVHSQVLEMVRGGRAPESFTVIEEMHLVGDVASQIYGPLNIFVDSSVRDLTSLASDQSVMIGEIKTFGWIRDTFGADATKNLSTSGDLGIVKTRLMQRGPSLMGTNLKDMIPAVMGSRTKDDPEMALVLTRFQPPSETYPEGRQTFFTPDEKIFSDGNNPYGEIPLVDYHWDVTATSFWSGDFMTDLVPAQKFANKRISQLGEQANASLYDLILLGPDLAREDLPTDYHGAVEDGVNDDGAPMVARVSGPSLPAYFLESIRLVIEFIMEVGGSDVFQKKNVPSQMRGPLAIPMYQEIIDSEDSMLFDHVGLQLARAKQMRINRVKQFYPPVRTLHYTGRSAKDEVLIFHAEKILRSGTEYNITIERSSMRPELGAIREAKMRERLNGPLAGLYLDPRTGRLDFSKIAQDLKFGDFDRESKEEKYRKLSREIIARLWNGEPAPQAMEFWNHAIIMDELEDVMITSEFMGASATLRNNFSQFWNELREFMQQRSDRMQQSIESQMIQGAVAQATQQAAAKAAAQASEDALAQIEEQQRLAQQPPSLTDQIRGMLTEGGQ